MLAGCVGHWISPGLASGICGEQSGAGAGFLRVLRFPLPIFIPPNSPSSSQSPGAGTVGHSVADVPSGPSMDSTPHPPLCELKKGQLAGSRVQGNEHSGSVKVRKFLTN
jgi:hypothetical protein